MRRVDAKLAQVSQPFVRRRAAPQRISKQSEQQG
jgi:hypothetical protein